MDTCFSWFSPKQTKTDACASRQWYPIVSAIQQCKMLKNPSVHDFDGRIFLKSCFSLLFYFKDFCKKMDITMIRCQWAFQICLTFSKIPTTNVCFLHFYQKNFVNASNSSDTNPSVPLCWWLNCYWIPQKGGQRLTIGHVVRPIHGVLCQLTLSILLLRNLCGNRHVSF